MMEPDNTFTANSKSKYMLMCIKPNFISCKSFRTKNIFFLNVTLWQHVTFGPDKEVSEATSAFH